MPIVFTDCETSSDLDLTRVGSHVYGWHVSTRPILWSVLTHDAPRALVFEDPDLYAILHRMKESRAIKGWNSK